MLLVVFLLISLPGPGKSSSPMLTQVVLTKPNMSQTQPQSHESGKGKEREGGVGVAVGLGDERRGIIRTHFVNV